MTIWRLSQPDKYFIDTYEFILHQNVFVGVNNVVETIAKGFALLELHVGFMSKGTKSMIFSHYQFACKLAFYKQIHFKGFESAFQVVGIYCEGKLW